MVLAEDSLVALAPFVLFLDLLHFFLGEVVFDVEVLELRIIDGIQRIANHHSYTIKIPKDFNISQLFHGDKNMYTIKEKLHYGFRN